MNYRCDRCGRALNTAGQCPEHNEQTYTSMSESVIPDEVFWATRDYGDVVVGGPDAVRKALEQLQAACHEANAAAIQKLGGTVIDLDVLDLAESALRGEQVVSFCAGYRNVLKPSPLQYVEPRLEQDWGDAR